MFHIFLSRTFASWRFMSEEEVVRLLTWNTESALRTICLRSLSVMNYKPVDPGCSYPDVQIGMYFCHSNKDKNFTTSVSFTAVHTAGARRQMKLASKLVFLLSRKIQRDRLWNDYKHSQTKVYECLSADRYYLCINRKHSYSRKKCFA